MIGMFALGMVQKLPCYNGAWFFGAGAQYTHACYSDIPHLFQGRGSPTGWSRTSTGCRATCSSWSTRC